MTGPFLSAAACLTILVVSISSAWGATECSSNGIMSLNSQACLSAVQDAVEDRNRFWFGSTYTVNCNGKSAYDSECYNPRSAFRDSLVSRIFQRKLYDRNTVRSVLSVRYQTNVGHYKACGNTYRFSSSRLVDIDPVKEDMNLTPFELVSRPMVSWEIRNSSTIYHTLAIIDAGYVNVQALYVNILGSSLNGGQAIVDYRPPLNPTSNNNPYVFLLFQQNSFINLQPQILHKLSLRDLGSLNTFLIQSNLQGPVAISWFTVRADPYSADNANKSPARMNTCAQFVDKALTDRNVPYVSRNRPPLNVYLDLTFNSPAFTFSCCCNKYSLRAGTYKPNPIADAETEPALMRFNASYVLRKSTAFPSRSRDFKGELLTMVMVDPFGPNVTTKARPYVHMLVSNIPEGVVEDGQSILPYMGPWPQDLVMHRYYFFLFKQTRPGFQPRPEDYAELICTGQFRGRCGFNMAQMIQDGGLELVGATWQRARQSDYVRCIYTNVPQVGESRICPSVQGYSPGCKEGPTSASPVIRTLNNAMTKWFIFLACITATHVITL